MKTETLPVDRSSGTGVPAAPRLPQDLVDPVDTIQRRFRRPQAEVREGAARAIASPEAALLHAVAAQADGLEGGCLGRALADLLVTGRDARLAWNAWVAVPGNGRGRFAAALGAIPSSADAATKEAAWNTVFDRIEAVTKYLDQPPGPRGRFVPPDGRQPWIASHAAIDPPRGPVNVGRTAFREVRASLVVPAFAEAAPIEVRYVVAGDLATAEHVVLYLHGLGSRGEECEGVARHLLSLGSYAVVAPDLPWNGYTRAPALPAALLKKDYDWDDSPTRRFPALERLERFVAAFVAHVPHLGDKVACLAGGSLGGTLTMRLSLDKSAWRPPRAAFWSPAGLWDAQNAVPIKHKEVCKPILGAATSKEVEGASPTGRRAYFYFNFIEDHPPFAGHNFESWWSAEFLASPEGKSHREGAIDDRLEQYCEGHRRAQYRLAYEQLAFSIKSPAPGRLALVGGKSAASARPLLLLCGTADDQPHVNLWQRMKDLAAAKVAQGHPGRAVWIEGAGHSLHDECPAQVARLLHEHITTT